MDDKEIRAICIAERQEALGNSPSSELGTQRATALDYYLGDMDEHMPVEEGSSRAVSTDVADVVESLLPPLMDIFTSGDDYCEFEPQGPEDEEAARQETDYVNHVFMDRNPGFMVLYTMIKDSLLSKTGVAKTWWQEDERVEKETYKGLDDSGLAAIMIDPEVEIVERTETPGEYGTAYDVTVAKKKKYGCVKVMAVPPEEFGIAKRARTVEEAPYCYHRYYKSKSELIEMGFKRSIVDDLPFGSSPENEEDVSRNTVEDDDDYQTSINNAMKTVEVTEHYIRLDRDGDGIAELLRVVTAGSGDKVLEVEEFDRMPFHSICPVPMTHRFFGRSIADLLFDIQRIKTHMLRALLDNASLLNNQRIAVGSIGSDDNTLDDLLTNRPGGIVRMRDVSQMREIPNQQIGGHILPLMEYVDQTRETRTGVTRTTQGLDPDVLNKASGTATGFQGLMDMSMMRIKMIARIFAETGIKSMFLAIHELVRKHETKPQIARLRNKWVQVDPRNWKTRRDMQVVVALGTGTKQQQLVYLNAVLERQVQAIELQGGASGPLVTLENVYNTVKRMVEMSGLKGAELYFTEPDMNNLPETPPDPEVVKAQAEMQIQQMKLQMEQQKSAAELDLDRQKSAAQLEMEREKSVLQQQLARDKAQAEYEIALTKMNFEQDLARQRMAMEAELAQQRAAMDYDVKMKSAEARISSNRPGGDLSQ